MMVPMCSQELDAGWASLDAGDWSSAKETFEGLSDGDPAPEVLDGLGRSRWWLKDVRGVIDARTGAYAAYAALNLGREPAHK